MNSFRIWDHVWREVRDYATAVSLFSHNARMYLFASALLSTAVAVHTVLYNLYLLDLRYDEAMVGQVNALAALGVAVGGLPAGMLYNGWRGRRCFLLATAGIGFSMALRSLVSSPWALLLGALLNGLANALFYVSIFPFITEQSKPQERIHLFSMNSAVWMGFAIAGSFIAGYLPVLISLNNQSSGVLFSERASLLLAAGLALVALIPLALVRSISLPSSNAALRVPSKPATHRWSAITSGGLIMFQLGLLIGLTNPFYNVYFSRVFQAGSELIGSLFSLSQLVILAGSFLIPFLVRRWGLIQGPIGAALAAAPFTLAMGLAFPFLVVVLSFLISSGLLQFIGTPLQNLLMEVVEQNDRGLMSGVRLVTSYGAQALAGWLGGWLVIRAGYSVLFAVAAAVALGMAVLVWLLYRGRERELETFAVLDKADV
ncbi:MAG TPA: MFS transporter [Anaerolineae bacterium]|nr:MFS transporter [Anaerolineae bacterium]